MFVFKINHRKSSTTRRYGKVRAASGSSAVFKRAERVVANYTKSVQRSADKQREANVALCFYDGSDWIVVPSQEYYCYEANVPAPISGASFD